MYKNCVAIFDHSEKNIKKQIKNARNRVLRWVGGFLFLEHMKKVEGSFIFETEVRY